MKKIIFTLMAFVAGLALISCNPDPIPSEPEDPGTETPAPDDPAPEDPAPEDPAPEDPVPEPQPEKPIAMWTKTAKYMIAF